MQRITLGSSSRSSNSRSIKLGAMSLPWLGFSILASDLHSWSKALKIVQNVIILDSDSDSDNDSVGSTQIDANVNSGAPEAELMNTLGLNLHNLPIADSMTQYLVHDKHFELLEMCVTDDMGSPVDETLEVLFEIGHGRV